jgi:hypothetical protein
MNEETNNKEVPDELQARIGTFLEGYKKLIDETKVDLASYPVWIPDAQGAFKCVVQSTPVDITNQGIKSPFITEEKA